MLCVKGPPEQEAQDGTLDVTRGSRCPLPTEGSILGTELLDCTRMNEDQSTDLWALSRHGKCVEVSPAYRNQFSPSTVQFQGPPPRSQVGSKRLYLLSSLAGPRFLFSILYQACPPISEFCDAALGRQYREGRIESEASLVYEGFSENGAGHLYSESPTQLREYLTQPSSEHTSSLESTVTSSGVAPLQERGKGNHSEFSLQIRPKALALRYSGSDTLHMASGDLDCKPLCEKEEEAREASAMPGASPAPENAACGESASVGVAKAASQQEAGEELRTTEDGGKGSASGETEVSTPPKASVKLVNFQQSENTSANEKEVEAEFLRLSLGLKCDWFTLEKRVKLEERSRDLAEENLKKEITNCLKLLEALTPLCEEDNQVQEIIKKLEKSIMFLSQCTARVASRAEMLGAINQESRVSRAVEVMIQHVENLKRMYAKEHAELEELKQALLQNDRSFNSLQDEDDCQIKKRSSSLNSKPSSLRRVTIASLPRNLGNVGLVSGMDNNDRFSRRSSSWRILGTKQGEHRPSLHRFISTYSWADAEDERCDVNKPETPRNRQEKSRSRGAGSPAFLKGEAVHPPGMAAQCCSSVASWVAGLQASFRRANRALWVTGLLIVLFAALVSVLTGQLFHTAVEAAPAQEGDSWMSLEHVLWPFTRLKHNGPPPV
ncbi:Inositol 1,4,5-triphosphate receptor-associated 2 [Apodemus speciosus]|uniref:Inositol 1,4,5-triphosphate receptor-associated 2 n=1 Tax=Apodemus speciosus TaxID=105296 RepID=A0ABQ0EWJ3_APOSI